MTGTTAQTQERTFYNVDWFRNRVAPLHPNFWNYLDEKVLNGKFGWMFFVVGLISFSSGILFSGTNVLLSFVGVGSFFLLYLTYSLSSKLKVKPAQWVTAPLAELLSSRFYDDTILNIQKVAETARAKEPLAEFVVEYLFDPKEQSRQKLPQNFILWLYPSFRHQERSVALLVQDGKVIA